MEFRRSSSTRVANCVERFTSAVALSTKGHVQALFKNTVFGVALRDATGVTGRDAIYRVIARHLAAGPAPRAIRRVRSFATRAVVLRAAAPLRRGLRGGDHDDGDRFAPFLADVKPCTTASPDGNPDAVSSCGISFVFFRRKTGTDG